MPTQLEVLLSPKSKSDLCAAQSPIVFVAGGNEEIKHLCETLKEKKEVGRSYGFSTGLVTV